jgi:hypothetical protein
MWMTGGSFTPETDGFVLDDTRASIGVGLESTVPPSGSR